MDFSILQKTTGKNIIYITDEVAKISRADALSKAQRKQVSTSLGQLQKIILHNDAQCIMVFLIKNKEPQWAMAEALRKTGAEAQALCNDNKLKEVVVHNLCTDEQASYWFAEGMALANYQFLKYKSAAKKLTHSLQKICFTPTGITLKAMQKLKAITSSIYHVRDLVNEPVCYLTATQLSEAFKALGKASGFKVTVWNKAKIESEKMGGILSVNLGSQEPPTFTIMEYKHSKPLHKKPIVLVGKGIVYDTGGLSLKPTPASMDRMKSDMSGAALVAGTMSIIAQLKLPLHVIALVPATDNRPGENAYTPGDVVKMYSGDFVEVLNTDAEGRMVLADALHYAKQLQPELVMDFATLTGAASVAVGDVGIVCMGTADDAVKTKLQKAGFDQYERLVEYPLWDEYGDMIKSDIADLKNIGGPSGGAITAGKFLQHFTDYPWMHFDIAGVSFFPAKKKYFTAGGTGFGVRMLVDFLEHYKQ